VGGDDAALDLARGGAWDVVGEEELLGQLEVRQLRPV
jgi:hypothetical protein